MFVSHDRYFVERLATRIVEVGEGKAALYPGTYTEFLWSKESGARKAVAAPVGPVASTSAPAGATLDKPACPPELKERRRVAPVAQRSYAAQKRDAADRRKRERALKNLRDRIADLEGRITERERAIKELEGQMADPSFYTQHEQSKALIDKHQSLMWEVGELLSQWEMLQTETETFADLKI
jgi:ATP-binding cassette subfamily F protein 3